MKRAVLVCLALLVGGPAAAGEMESPAITLSDVNWDAAAASLSDHGSEPPAEAFAAPQCRHRKALSRHRQEHASRCCCRSTSRPFARMLADGKPEAASVGQIFRRISSDQILPAGTGRLRRDLHAQQQGRRSRNPFRQADRGRDLRRRLRLRPRSAPITSKKKNPPPKDLAAQFPGIRRILSEAHVRYVFERFGVPYVAVHPVLRHAALVAASGMQGSRSDRDTIL